MLKPERAWLLSTNFLNCSKVIFWNPSAAALYDWAGVANFFDNIRPICWMAETFQSKVLAWTKLPPKERRKLSVEGVPRWPLEE
jgi:hypothetical protein